MREYLGKMHRMLKVPSSMLNANAKPAEIQNVNPLPEPAAPVQPIVDSNQDSSYYGTVTSAAGTLWGCLTICCHG